MTPFLSQTIAKILLGRSPLHAWYSHPQLNPNYKETFRIDFDLGSAAHDLLLEGGTKKIAVIDPALYPSKDGNVPKGWTNNAIREARDAARAERKYPVLLSDMAEIEAMRDVAVEAILRCVDLSGLTLADGVSEKEIICEYRGITMRGRPDWISNAGDVILDYKTTADAEPSAFSRQIAKMGYHIQDAFYRRLLNITTAVNPKFIFLAQETEPPYACSFHGVDPSMAEIADAQVDRAIALWAECVKRNSWPGYSNRVHWVAAQNWQMAEHEEAVAEGIQYDPAKLWDKNERIAA